MKIFYKLDKNKNIIECNAQEFSDQIEEMFKSGTKHIADDTINGKRISTVWLGINHQWSANGPPILFETMIFDNEKNFCESYCVRYSSWKEAEEGHARAVQWVKEGCKEDEA